MRVRLPRRRSDRPVVVCGSDSLALRLVEELGRMEEHVTVVVEDADTPLARRLVRMGARVIAGSARETRTLRAAGVASARALALVDDDDVGNIHAALAAQDLNPRLRLVVRMFNLRLGRRIDDLFDDCTVLSASTIAAPFFVEAALGDGKAQQILAGDRQLVAGPPSSVREVLAVPAGVDETGAKSLLPDAAAPTLVLGSPREPGELDAVEAGALGAPGPAPAVPKRRRRSRGRTATLLAIARALVSFRLRVLVAALAALMALATAVFRAGVPKLTWLDALAITVKTFTSTGDVNLAALGAPTGIRVFGAGLTLFGVLTVAVITAVVVDDLIGARLAHSLGVPLGHREDHVVVCGLGTVGQRVTEQLRAAGVEVVAIERDPDPAAYAAARRLGVPLVRGDASEEETLRAAGITTARCHRRRRAHLRDRRDGRGAGAGPCAGEDRALAAGGH